MKFKNKKYEIQGNTISVELPEDVPVEKDKKEKRVMSDKQKDNLKKGMAALKAKRESLRAEQESDSQQEIVVDSVAAAVPSVPSSQEKKTTKTHVRRPYIKKSYVGVEEFNNFKNELLTTLNANGRPSVKETIIEKPVDRVVDRVVEKVVEKPVDKYLSGSELLNRIFFK